MAPYSPFSYLWILFDIGKSFMVQQVSTLNIRYD